MASAHSERQSGEDQMTSPNRLAIDALAAALAASGRHKGYSFTTVEGRDDPALMVATFTFRFPPGWVLPKDVAAFARELYEQLYTDQAAWIDAPDPRMLKLLDLANRMHSALRRDESAVSLMMSEQVLREHWPQAIVAESVRRIDDANARTTREVIKHGREIHDMREAYRKRIASLKRTRAMRTNPIDPRRPA